eukprot:scaffold38118_cov32-Tisochrysis_lutea.AAC.3
MAPHRHTDSVQCIDTPPPPPLRGCNLRFGCFFDKCPQGQGEGRILHTPRGMPEAIVHFRHSRRSGPTLANARHNKRKNDPR